MDRTRLVPMALMVVGLAACHRHPHKILASAEVGADGAHLEGKGFVLDIPAGAVAGNEHVSVSTIADDPAMDPPPLTDTFHLEPEGLTFDKPIRFALTVPNNGGGVVRWSTDDGEGFEFAGFAADGVAIAENTHFSDVAAAPLACPEDDPQQRCEGCEDPETGEPTCQTCTQQALCGDDRHERCRRQCYCKAPDDALGLLCATVPTTYTSQCQKNPGVASNDGYVYLGERDGESCNGFHRQARTVTICDCQVDTPNPGSSLESLCALPWKKGATGTWACDTTLAWPASYPNQPAPMTPPNANDPAHTEYADPKYSDFGISAYVDGRPATCKGHWRDDRNGTTKDGGELTGKFMACNTVRDVDYHWQSYTGTGVQCSEFDWPPGMTIPEQDPKAKARCRLTEGEWEKLGQRRSDCNIPPLPKHTLSILTVPSEPTGNLTELTGVSSKARVNRPANDNGLCPPQVPITNDYKGIGATTMGETDIQNSNVTAGHAEGNALLQLAQQRGRTPPAGDGTGGSDWGAVGGRTGGCGEMIVDRAPCGYSCAKEGVDNGRITAGLGLVIVRSPSGCLCFGDGLGSRGRKCISDSASCAGWTGPQDSSKVCPP